MVEPAILSIEEVAGVILKISFIDETKLMWSAFDLEKYTKSLIGRKI
jgi:hypothetical protein